MAATSSSSGATQRPPASPVDDRDYVNPGMFVMPWSPIYIVEDPSLMTLLSRVPTVDIPWDALATLKVHAPDVSKDIVIAGWEGVGDIVRRLEQAVLQNMKYNIR